MLSRLKSLLQTKAPDERLVPVFIPPLATILLHKEKVKGAPLTEEEILAIRGRSVVMMMRESHAFQMEEKRGFRDINPEFCWLEWCVRRQNRSDEKPGLKGARANAHSCHAACYGMKMEMKQLIAESNEARGAPAAVVAYL